MDQRGKESEKEPIEEDYSAHNSVMRDIVGDDEIRDTQFDDEGTEARGLGAYAEQTLLKCNVSRAAAVCG
jgi:hypothetical protein